MYSGVVLSLSHPSAAYYLYAVPSPSRANISNHFHSSGRHPLAMRFFAPCAPRLALKHDDLIADVSHLVIMSSKLLVHRELNGSVICESALSLRIVRSLCFKHALYASAPKRGSHYLWSCSASFGGAAF
jgi:hypothetical protein